MARGINRFLSYLIVIAFLSTATNLSYLSQQEFQSQTDTLRSQAAVLGLDMSLMKVQLTVSEQEMHKTSSSGSAVLDQDIKLAVQTKLKQLLQLMEYSESIGTKERYGIRLELSGNDFLSDEFQSVIKDFKSKVIDDFGKNVYLSVSDIVDGRKDLFHVGVLIDPITTEAFKSSSGGTTVLDPDIRSSLQKHLDRLVALRGVDKGANIESQLAVTLELPEVALVDNDFLFMLENFTAQIKQEFGENITYSFNKSDVQDKILLSLGVSEEALHKTSSGGSTKLDSDIKSSLKKHLDRLVELKRTNEIASIEKQLVIILELPEVARTDSDVLQILEDFTGQLRLKFGESLECSFSESDVQGKVLLSLAAGEGTLHKTSSGGTDYTDISAHYALNAQTVYDFKQKIKLLDPRNPEKVTATLTLPINGHLFTSVNAAMNEFRIAAKEEYGIVVETSLLTDESGMIFSIGGNNARREKGYVQTDEDIKLGRLLRSSSSGTIASTVLDPDIKLSLQKHLDRLVALKGVDKDANIENQLAITLELPEVALVDNNFLFILENFTAQMQQDFGENIIYGFTKSDVQDKVLLVLEASEGKLYKSSSSGDSKSLPVELSFEKQLAEQLALRRAGTITSIKKKIVVTLSLPTDNRLFSSLLARKKGFVDTVKQEFGEIVVTEFVFGNGSVSISIGGSGSRKEQESVTDTWKSSSGGTILKSNAEKISALVRNIKANVDVKKRFDTALEKLNGLGAAAANEAKDILTSVHKALYKRLDADIMDILSFPDSTMNPEDIEVLKDMVGIAYQAEQHVSNIETIMYADKGKLSEDTAPRVMILPAVGAVASQVVLATEELQAIKDNLGIITVVSNDLIGTINSIKKGKLLFDVNGANVRIPANNIAVMLSADQRGMAGDVNNALGTNNTLVMSNISTSQYVPFSQLAMLAKVQLILNKIGVTSSEAGPYRSAFLAIWKSVTGDPFIGSVEQFIANPAAYVISILAAPASTLSEIEIKMLHDKAARIWA